MATEETNVPVKDKIKQVLTETRVVLPGAQALLGFAGITTLLDAFHDLPSEARYVHLVGLCAVALSMLLLMTPAAVHRIAEHGDASERFYKLASTLVLAGLAALALSLAAEVFVVFLKVLGSQALSATAAFLSLAGFLGIWFVLPLILAKQQPN